MSQKKLEPRRQINIVVPESTYIKVKTLLLDPLYGRTKYGRMSGLITSLLNGWIDTQTIKEEGPSNGI